MSKISIACVAAVALTACYGAPPATAVETDRAETNRLQNEAASQVGLPRVQNFTEKRLATKLAELRDKPNLLTYAYVQGIDGKLTCFGKGIGFGIPYSTQITNPQTIEDRYEGDVAIPQAEPNGLYMPDSAAATWYMLIDPATGEASPIYVEPSLTVSTRPLTGPAVSVPCSK
jgi:hypothetical protein